jgi:hypothetical protein
MSLFLSLICLFLTLTTLFLRQSVSFFLKFYTYGYTSLKYNQFSFLSLPQYLTSLSLYAPLLTVQRLTKVSAPHFMETKVRRISAPLGLSAVQLDPMAQDTGTGTASMLTTMQTARTENKGRKGTITSYMNNTRQPHDKDRRNKGRKASGFTNCFQSQETADFNGTGMSHNVGGIQILPDFTPDEDLQNCIEERMPSNPSLSPEGPVSEVPPESAFKPEGFSMGTVRTVAMRRRQREREEDEGENKDKTMNSKGSESEAQAGAMQRKLVQMWECLQVTDWEWVQLVIE